MIGPAVNLVSRVETVAKALDLPIVVSEAFARVYGGHPGNLVAMRFGFTSASYFELGDEAARAAPKVAFG